MDKEINEHSKTKKYDTQTRIDNEKKNDQKENPIEPIDPSLLRDWRYNSSHPQE